MNLYASADETRRLLITETSEPTSFDPLDADAWQNMSVARMRYLTPIEASRTSGLMSTVLKSYTYDEKKLTMSWELRTGLHFSDGSPITVIDVAFSVVRFASAHPDFPVIRELVGVEKWVKESKKNKKSPLESLPEGIRIENNQIIFKFINPVEHPLFRFSLEIFSIIPKSSVDLKTNQLKQPIPPASGYYDITEKTPEMITFERRKELKEFRTYAPNRIQFIYINPDSVASHLKTLDQHTVISGNEHNYIPSDISQFAQNSEIRYLQSSWFTAFMLNPRQKPFQSKGCRVVFANLFRDVFSRIFSNQLQVEASVFTSILPGYLSYAALKKNTSPLSKAEEKKCLDAIRKSPITWGVTEGSTPILYQTTMKEMYKELGTKLAEPIHFTSRVEQGKAFAENKVSIYDAFTGFWPSDPIGDIQMLFTPNFHLVLKFAASDNKLQILLKELQTSQKRAKNPFKTVNQHIFESAYFNVYMHVRKFFIARKDDQRLRNIPLAIASVSPWDLFAAE